MANNLQHALHSSSASTIDSPFQVMCFPQERNSQVPTQSTTPLIAQPQLQHKIVVVPSLAAISSSIIPKEPHATVAHTVGSVSQETVANPATGVEAVAIHQRPALAASLSTSLLASSLLAPLQNQKQQILNRPCHGVGQVQQSLYQHGNTEGNITMGIFSHQNCVENDLINAPRHASESDYAHVPCITQLIPTPPPQQLVPSLSLKQYSPTYTFHHGKIPQEMTHLPTIHSNIMTATQKAVQQNIGIRGSILTVPMITSASYLAADPSLKHLVLKSGQLQQLHPLILTQNSSSLGRAATDTSLMGCTSSTKAPSSTLSPAPLQPPLPPRRLSHHDMSLQPDPPAPARGQIVSRGGVTDFFPDRLHRMLSEVENAGQQNIVGYFAHGRAFCVFKPDKFVSEIMSQFYKEGKLSSFQRQLNLYGFTRIRDGPDIGGYYHDFFLRGRPGLCRKIRRLKNTRQNKGGGDKGISKHGLDEGRADLIPNFYDMPAITTAEDAEARQGHFGANVTTVPVLPDTSLSLEGKMPAS